MWIRNLVESILFYMSGRILDVYVIHFKKHKIIKITVTRRDNNLRNYMDNN